LFHNSNLFGSVSFTYYIQDVLKLKINSGAKRLNCCLASETNALRTVQCCHIALRTVVVVQHLAYSSNMHTAEHLKHTDTFTVTTGADTDRRPTGDRHTAPSSLPVLSAVPQFSCSGTDSLLQRARFTVRYSPRDRLHTSAGIHALNKETLKKQSETERQKWRSAAHSTHELGFHRIGILTMVSWPNYCQTVTNMYSFQATVQVANALNSAKIQLSVVNKRPFLNSDISMCAQHVLGRQDGRQKTEAIFSARRYHDLNGYFKFPL